MMVVNLGQYWLDRPGRNVSGLFKDDLGIITSCIKSLSASKLGSMNLII